MYYSDLFLLLLLIGAVIAIVILVIRFSKKDEPKVSYSGARGPDLIRQYRELYEGGAITLEEYERKKREILEGRESKGSFLDYVDELAEDGSYRILWFVIGFFIQLVGIVLFILWRKEHPMAAKYALAGAVVPLAVVILLSICNVVV